MVKLDPSLANSAAALRLIGILQSVGFENGSFWRLHHLRRQNRCETIGSFSAYCRTPRDFHLNGENHRVVARLNYVLDAYICGEGSRPIHNQDAWNSAHFFNAAADEAYQRLPPVDE